MRYTGSECVVAREVSKQPPWSMAMSTTTQPCRIRATVASTPVPLAGGGSLGLTVSIGLAPFPESADSASQLFAHADQALYQAKQAGRNCFKVFGG